MQTDGPAGRRLLLALLALALVAHGLQLSSAWTRVTNVDHGRDFASYYYAARAAAAGVDPYDASVLGALAREDGTRASVHPFLYPPPFVAMMSWTRPFSLSQAYRIWFWLDSCFLFAALWTLWRWSPRPATAGSIGLLLATFTPIHDTHWMGQANLLVLALLCIGVHATTRGRSALGGAVVGVACMLKPLPAVIVLWWLVRKQWRPCVGVAASSLLMSLVTLPVLGLQDQLRFYLSALPSLGSGSYGGLSVPIGTGGNHSIANLLASVWPADTGLSQAALLASLACSLALLAAALFALRKTQSHPPAALASFGALCAIGLLLPLYSFEHHLVFTIPAWVALGGAVADGRLARPALLGLAAAYAFVAWPLSWLFALSAAAPASLARLVLEAKFVGLAVLAFSTVRFAARETDASTTNGAA
jgi:alpha-1,2-mannosyltransferase